MRQTPWIFVGLLLFSAGGCATLTRGEDQDIKFATEPPGATVQVGGAQYTTPAKIPLKRKEEHDVLITRQGYRPVTFTMKAQWDGAALGNVIMPGGSIGMAADRANGSDLAFHPLPLIKLEPAQTATTQPLQMYQYHGQLLTEEQYNAAVEEDRRALRSKEIDF